jgi:hypothetical protein
MVFSLYNLTLSEALREEIMGWDGQAFRKKMVFGLTISVFQD